MRTAALALSMLLCAGCAAGGTGGPPAATESSSAAPSESADSQPVREAADENAYLDMVVNYAEDVPPSELVRIGYGVCDSVQRNWGLEIISREVENRLFPPGAPRPTSLYHPDFPKYISDLVMGSAMLHLCGMSEGDLAEYGAAHATETTSPAPGSP